MTLRCAPNFCFVNIVCALHACGTVLQPFLKAQVTLHFLTSAAASSNHIGATAGDVTCQLSGMGQQPSKRRQDASSFDSEQTHKDMPAYPREASDR